MTHKIIQIIPAPKGHKAMLFALLSDGTVWAGVPDITYSTKFDWELVDTYAIDEWADEELDDGPGATQQEIEEDKRP